MLFRVALPIKLLEFWRLMGTGHVEYINPLGVRLGVEVSLARTSTLLYLNCICNQVLDLVDDHQVWRPTILKFTTHFSVDLLVGSFTLDERPLFLLIF